MNGIDPSTGTLDFCFSFVTATRPPIIMGVRSGMRKSLDFPGSRTLFFSQQHTATLAVGRVHFAGIFIHFRFDRSINF
jgi:hypothetical protein